MPQSGIFKRAQHPRLQLILDKLYRGASLSTEELYQLQVQIAELEGRARAHKELERSTRSDPVLAPQDMESLLPGHATCGGEERFVGDDCRRPSAEFYNKVQGILISNIGIGTYRGAMSHAADAKYAAAIHAAIEGGVNLIDTSLNYRNQRSERAIRTGLRLFIEKSGGQRNEIVVCTKGGYLLPEAITSGTLDPEDVVDGAHSIAPDFLADQIHRSRRNLGLGTIDVYYIHNPEIQARRLDPQKFMDRIRAAFDGLERAVSSGFIRYYGTATWDGFQGGQLSLEALALAARQIAGDKHHFRFVQLPFNLGMPEALWDRAKSGRTVLDLATELGITVIASSSLLQGRLSRDLPDVIAQMLPGLNTDAQRAIQFVRSAPGVASALVGMGDETHVAENLVLAKVPSLTRGEYRRLCSKLSDFLGTPFV